ncbi:hypothetical protein LQV63_04310 [Paenibacillus profundus]|uniref:Tail fiber protein n=1 Tax=Paenibacillus profundus TaxID=1173085 RepID=A0ABS8YC27_9BACL|nr:hypothetical protein [Paenibacillus profundus]MCE5168537.1 hypothetical protein [Paenibacillus profundus]
MAFQKELPEWKAAGIQPPESKRVKGWEIEDRPPADWLNWQTNRTFEALKELQEKAAEKTDITTVLEEAKSYANQAEQRAKDASAEELDTHVSDTQKHVSDTERPKWNSAAVAVAETHSKDLALSPGVQVVEVDNDTPFNFGEVKGRTLINLSTGLRNLERWKVNTTGAALELVTDVTDQGSASLKATVKASTPGEYTASWNLRDRINFGTIGEDGASFLLVARVRNGTATRASVEILSGIFIGDLPVTDSKFTTVRKAFSRSKNGPNTFDMHIRVTGQNGDTAYVDGIRVYRIADTIDNALIDSINNMDRDEVDRLYPYVDSMTNVRNPYAIVTGGNLLPPFTEWETEPNAMAKAVSPYEAVAEITSDGTKAPLRTIIPVLPDTTYTISSEGNAIPGNGLQIIERKDGKDGDPAGEIEDGYWRSVPGGVAVGTVTFTTTAQTHYLSIRLRFDKAGIYTIKKPLVVPGDKPIPFTPQQRSMIAFETELAANPVDGTNPDLLFVGEDGLQYVLEKWRTLVLDGRYTYEKTTVTNTGFKSVLISNLASGSASPGDDDDYGKLFATKFDGKQLTVSDIPIANWLAADLVRINHVNVYFSIANTDSGWGPDYTPDADEIKAYFLGWKMYDNINPSNPHTGVGKAWVKLTCRGADGTWATQTSDARTTVPTVPAGTDTNGRLYTPYRLQYLKAKPTVEPVQNYELGATLSAGSNMVEVGSGIVLREKANPSYYSENDSWFINNGVVTWESTRFQHKANKIINIYEGATKDSRWTVENISLAYGNERAYLSNSYYDPTAVYHVTYTMLEPTLAAPISGSIATNLRGTVSDLVQYSGDMERRLSVVEMQKADAVEDTGWIKVPPLNGWIHYAAKPLRFRVKGNLLYIEGILQGGTTATTTQLFNLPITLKTAYGCWLNCITWTGANTVQPLQCSITTSGIMRINAGTADTYISFDGVGLLIEGLEVKKS